MARATTNAGIATRTADLAARVSTCRTDTRSSGDPLRLGILIDRWQPERGGAERALAQLAEHLEERGHEVLTFGLQGPRDVHPAPGRFMRVRAFGLTRGARERSFADSALRAAEREDCDLTLGVRHLPRCDVYWPHGGAHAETLRVLSKPARGRHRTFLDLERQALEGGARRVVCVSEAVRAEFAHHYPASVERLTVIENGVPLEHFHPRERVRAREALGSSLGSDAPPVRIGFMGRNARLKGLDTLLEAARGLSCDGWQIVAAGPTDARDYEARGRRAGLGPERWRVLPDLPALELAAGTDLCVLPTRRDPAPLVVLEALACGTPVLTTARAGTGDAIEAGISGELLADPDDADALRDALTRWIERLHREPPEPERVRLSVTERGLEQSLERMEQLLVALSPRSQLS